MTARCAVKITASFEHNLEELETFLLQADAPRAFDALLSELMNSVVPNLASFPDMGRLFLERPAQSTEAMQGIDQLAKQLHAVSKNAELREYVMAHYLLLYARIQDTVYLLSIRHQRQISFDFQGVWPSGPGNR